MEGISENQNVQVPDDHDTDTMNYLHKSDSDPMPGGSVKSRAMSLAGTDVQHDVDMASFVHHRSPSVGSNLAPPNGSIKLEKGASFNESSMTENCVDPEDQVGGRPIEPFGPKRLYQSRERDKRQKVDHSPVGRRMGGTKGSTKAAEAIAKQRKVANFVPCCSQFPCFVKNFS